MAGPGGPRGRASFLTEEEKQNTPKITKELLLRVFSYLQPYWKQLALVLGCIVVSSVCSAAPGFQPDRRGGGLPEQLDRPAYFV